MSETTCLGRNLLLNSAGSKASPGCRVQPWLQPNTASSASNSVRQSLASIGKYEANEDNEGSVMAYGSDDSMSGEAAKSRDRRPRASRRAQRARGPPRFFFSSTHRFYHHYNLPSLNTHCLH